MKQLGLKIYSTDARRMSAIERLFKRHLFDYIELYAVPGTFRSTAAAWRSIDISYIIHVAHASYGFNLALRACARKNSKIFAEARRFADMLEAPYLICHPGVQGSLAETVRQLKCFADDRILIENKPVVSLDGKRCIGFSPGEVRRIMDGAGCGLCFDITHCVKYCYTEGYDLFDEFDRFMRMRPPVVHLCDGFRAGCFDEHYAFGAGNFPLDKFCKQIRQSSTVSHITVETPKRTKQWESDVERDFHFLIQKFKGNPGDICAEERIKFRKAGEDDCLDLLLWRNHLNVRKQSFEGKKIGLAEHMKWFSKKLSDKNTNIYVVETENLTKIGQIRFDIIKKGTARVNINLNPKYIGRSFGTKVIAKGTRLFLKENPSVENVIAEILDKNVASRKAFQKAAYIYSRSILKGNKRCHVYIWRSNVKL